jgi:hypothetical protein
MKRRDSSPSSGCRSCMVARGTRSSGDTSGSRRGLCGEARPCQFAFFASRAVANGPEPLAFDERRLKPRATKMTFGKLLDPTKFGPVKGEGATALDARIVA